MANVNYFHDRERERISTSTLDDVRVIAGKFSVGYPEGDIDIFEIPDNTELVVSKMDVYKTKHQGEEHYEIELVGRYSKKLSNDEVKKLLSKQEQNG